jgi:hypothetical protein
MTYVDSYLIVRKFVASRNFHSIHMIGSIFDSKATLRPYGLPPLNSEYSLPSHSRNRGWPSEPVDIPVGSREPFLCS